MNPEIKHQWTDALRSGKYRQGRNTLYDFDDDTYCCLGVLCDLAEKAGAVKRHVSEYGRVTWDGESVWLPLRVREWAGLTDSDPYVPLGGSEGYTLSDANDAREYSFGRIADIIDVWL